jgi:3-oxoadipate enol-lactonase
VKLAWDAHGSGVPLLMIQGLGYTRHGWGPLSAALSARYRVLLYDNRGIGESDIPEGPYTVAELAGDAAAVLEEAGVGRAHVLGASLGGMVAQELARTRPERIDRLALVCTTGGGAGSFPMPERTVQLMASAADLDPSVAMRRFVENALGPDAPERLADEVLAHRLAHPPDPAGWQAQVAAGVAWDGLELASGIRAPTLVVTGTEDNVVDARNSSLLAERIPGARLEQVERAGHLVFWERPDELATVLEEFFG